MKRPKTNREMAMKSLSDALRDLSSATSYAYRGEFPAWIMRGMDEVRGKPCALRMAAEECAPSKLAADREVGETEPEVVV
jgi:hypothetical protein